jgi:predicted transcriptional regulator of viral defense system
MFCFCFRNALILVHNRNIMNFIEFRNRFLALACFNTNQVYASYPEFNRNNLVHWVRQGYLTRLRQGYYTFPEYRESTDFTLYFANIIYKPSYISLQTALSFYGIIPEAVPKITSVTTLKTKTFNNDFGEYSYKNVKPDMMFGYELRLMEGGRRIMFATPEKALADLLYLYPFYNTERELEELRLDESYMENDLNTDRLMGFSDRIGSKALSNRIDLLRKVHNL